MSKDITVKFEDMPRGTKRDFVDGVIKSADHMIASAIGLGEYNESDMPRTQLGSRGYTTGHMAVFATLASGLTLAMMHYKK